MVISKPVPNRMTERGVRSALYKGIIGPLPDLSVLTVEEAFRDMLDKPLVTTMGMSEDKALVESAFGTVQKGSILSYQQPLMTTKHIQHHPDSPLSPRLPLEDCRLATSNCVFVTTEDEHFHLQSLQVSLNMAHKIEEATRDQSSVQDWHPLRRPRITSTRFREVCHVRGQSSAESLAERIIRGTRQTAEMKRGTDMEFGAAMEYSQIMNVNYSSCGLIIHPDAPWLGASPDGLVFDPTEYPPFGLVEIKCPNVKNYVDCKFLQMNYVSSKLRKSHAYYWQVQGQLLLTGLKWCDFMVWAQEDFLVQRLYSDLEVQELIREKADSFYFNVYMPKYLSLKV